jgi:hypothetical protein
MSRVAKAPICAMCVIHDRLSLPCGGLSAEGVGGEWEEGQKVTYRGMGETEENIKKIK